MRELRGMADAVPPFRPKLTHESQDVLAAVRSQVVRCRRRSNAFTAQRALYSVGGGALTAICLLVGLAFFLPLALYAAVVWGAVAAFAGLGAITAIRVRQEWIPKRRASIFIDHRAGLEDRLATLAACPNRHSRLWGVLLRDNLRILPRWTPRALVPRAVPRNLWFPLVALLVMLGLFRQVQREPTVATTVPEAAETEGLFVSEAHPTDRGEVESTEEGAFTFLSALPEKLREAILRSAAREAGQGIGEGQHAGSRSGEEAGTAEHRRGSEGGDPRSGQTYAAQGMPEGDASVGAESGEAPGKTAQRSVAGGNRLAALQREPARGDGPKPLPRVETGRPRESARRPLSKSGRTAGKGGGSQGAGRGGDRPGLFGPPDLEGPVPGSFSVDLAGARGRSAGDREGELDFAGRPASDLASEQGLDDAIRRAQIPPEYERIVQKIFSRSDDGPGSPSESSGPSR